MIKSIGVLLLVLSTLLPLTAQAQTAGGSWQVYTVANGLREWPSYTIAPDGAGGVWVGHISGGRGIYRQGGLSHIRADGSSQTYREAEPFQSCSSVDALAATPDGGVWMWLSGYHDYGYNDYLQRTCLKAYGVRKAFPIAGTDAFDTIALGYIGADGVPQMVPKEQLPTTMTSDLAVDAYGRPWVGTTNGAAMREPNGVWRTIAVWTDGSTTSAVYATGPTTMLGSSNGGVATIATPASAPDQISVLPRPTADTSTYVSDIAAGSDGIGVIIGRQFYRWNGNAWNALALPIPGQFGNEPYGQTVAYTGGTFWVGAPPYGLYRLDGASWTPIPAGVTPLPSPGVNDVVAGSSATLLIATYHGAAQLNTNGPAPDSSRARQAFNALWQRTNRNTQGSWVWGPRAWAERYEGYKEGPGGYRFVRYYDKTRMEVSDPQADPNSQWYVTNGLLVTEMVRGRAQFSNDPALSQCPFYVNSGACASGTRVAGDIGLSVNNPAPYYGVFGEYLAGVERRSGQRVSATLRETSPGTFTLGQESSLGTKPTILDMYDATTQHNIPRAFWNYMRAQPIDWLYTFGHPITEPYWIRATIGGNEQWVMVQLFERRTLTYTPANQPPWQVEMGNVGQHYYQWRYGAYENPPWEQ